jgi:hypothetical protein
MLVLPRKRARGYGVTRQVTGGSPAGECSACLGLFTAKSGLVRHMGDIKIRNAFVDSERLKEDGGVKALRGMFAFELAPGHSAVELRARLRTYFGDNDIDEVLIRGDDGKLYLLYVDDLPTHNLARGRRFVSDQVSGTIEHVEVESDDEEAKARGDVLLLEVGCVLIGLAFAAETAGLSLVMGGGAAYFIADRVEAGNDEKPRSLEAFDLLRGPARPAATSPEEALRPKR